MMEFIQVTAQYSNAVLVAILPQISDFVKKVELPMPTPVVVEQVREFRCWRINDGDRGGAVILTNGLCVWYQKGHVTGFRTPRSYYNLQDPREIPRFYGVPVLSRDEALGMARKAVLNAGYSLKETFTDQDPEIDGPPQIGTNVVPHYRFQWKDPVFSGTAVKIEVDASRKLLHEMRLSSRFFWRDPPKIAVEAVILNPQPQIASAASNEFLLAVCPRIGEFARKLKLPIKTPVAQSQIDRVCFIGSTAQAWTRLKSGYWFVCEGGVIDQFYGPDRVFNGPPSAFDRSHRPLAEYLGRWRMGEEATVDLVRSSIARLSYNVEDFFADRKPEVTKHEEVGKYVVPRYFVRWLTNDPGTGATIAMVRAEVDADKKRLVSLQLLSERLWREAAKENARTASAATSTNRTANPSGTKEITIEDAIKFLDHAMGSATNGTSKPVPPTNAPSPFE